MNNQSSSVAVWPTIVGIGAAYIDVILTVSEYPTEDSKARASSCERRRGGNVPNTLEVFGQLCEAAKIRTKAYLFAALPAEDSLDSKSIIDSLPAGVSAEHAVFRSTKSEAPTSYIIRSQASGSRTIVSHNEVGELTIEDFHEAVPRIVPEGQLVYHFEGRIPDVAIECMQHLRIERPHAHISVELEKPKRPGLEEMAENADIVFHSKSWAVAEGYDSAESCVRGQAAKLSHAKYLFCTWGDQDTACIYQDGPTLHFESCPTFEAGLNVVDTVGAGDTFIAAVLFGLYYQETQWTLYNTLRFANELAGRKVAQDGLDGLTKEMSVWFNDSRATGS